MTSVQSVYAKDEIAVARLSGNVIRKQLPPPGAS
jgi:hypothetical protein